MPEQVASDRVSLHAVSSKADGIPDRTLGQAVQRLQAQLDSEEPVCGVRIASSIPGPSAKGANPPLSSCQAQARSMQACCTPLLLLRQLSFGSTSLGCQQTVAARCRKEAVQYTKCVDRSEGRDGGLNGETSSQSVTGN